MALLSFNSFVSPLDGGSAILFLDVVLANQVHKFDFNSKFANCSIILSTTSFSDLAFNIENFVPLLPTKITQCLQERKFLHKSIAVTADNVFVSKIICFLDVSPNFYPVFIAKALARATSQLVALGRPKLERSAVWVAKIGIKRVLLPLTMSGHEKRVRNELKKSSSTTSKCSCASFGSRRLKF